MKDFFQNALVTFRRFHDDEQGMETVNIVMILAIAAMVAIVLITVGNEIVEWMKEKWESLKGEEVKYGG